MLPTFHPVTAKADPETGNATLNVTFQLATLTEGTVLPHPPPNLQTAISLPDKDTNIIFEALSSYVQMKIEMNGALTYERFMVC